MGDQHAELRAPVADVVLADDLVALELDHAAERVADDGAAQVSDVHLLGDVRARVVHDGALGVRGRFDAKAPVPVECAKRRVEPGRDRRTLMKPGPAMDTSYASSPRRVLSTICLRDRARVGLVPVASDTRLHQAHGGVGLVVAELLVLRHGDEGIGVDPESGRDCGSERLVKLSSDRLHGSVPEMLLRRTQYSPT